MRPIYGCPENFRVSLSVPDYAHGYFMAAKSEGVGLIARAISLQDFQPM